MNPLRVETPRTTSAKATFSESSLSLPTTTQHNENTEDQPLHKIYAKTTQILGSWSGAQSTRRRFPDEEQATAVSRCEDDTTNNNQFTQKKPDR